MAKKKSNISTSVSEADNIATEADTNDVLTNDVTRNNNRFMIMQERTRITQEMKDAIEIIAAENKEELTEDEIKETDDRFKRVNSAIDNLIQKRKASQDDKNNRSGDNPWESSNAFENGVIPPSYLVECHNLSSDDFAIDALFSLACSSVEKSRWISERLGVRELK